MHSQVNYVRQSHEQEKIKWITVSLFYTFNKNFPQYDENTLNIGMEEEIPRCQNAFLLNTTYQSL